MASALSLAQFQAVDLLHYHAGWNFALNRQVGDELFHATTPVNFRQRLLDHDLGTIGFALVLETLIEAGLVARQSRQRLDSTQMFGRVSRTARWRWVSIIPLCRRAGRSSKPNPFSNG